MTEAQANKLIAELQLATDELKQINDTLQNVVQVLATIAEKS